MANPDGSSGDAWMRARCGLLPRVLPADCSLLVVHAALDAPASGVAKDLLGLLALGEGADITVKVSRIIGSSSKARSTISPSIKAHLLISKDRRYVLFGGPDVDPTLLHAPVEESSLHFHMTAPPGNKV